MNPHLAKTIFFFSLFLKHAFKFFMNKRRKCICFNSPKVLLCCNHPFSICYSYHKMYQTPSYSLMASLCSEIKVLSLPWLYQKDSFCVYNLHHPNKILHLQSKSLLKVSDEPLGQTSISSLDHFWSELLFSEYDTILILPFSKHYKLLLY